MVTSRCCPSWRPSCSTPTRRPPCAPPPRRIRSTSCSPPTRTTSSRSVKAAKFYAPGDIRLEQIAEPEVAPGEIKIRVRACSMCGTDVKIWRSGHPNMSAPQVMGHEIAGEIVDVGAGVSGWAPGDRVQVIAAIPDGTCAECVAGHQAICPNQLSMGYQFPGGFAEYLIVPEQVLAVDGLTRIPENLNFAEASLAEPLACVLNGQEL